MNQASKSSLFKKYVGSYLIVFFIPFALFLAVVNMEYIQNLRRELISTQENILQQSNTLLDEQIMEMNLIGNKINQSRMFISPTLSSAPDHSAYVDFLMLYKNSSKNIKDIFIIIDANPMVYSSRGTMSMTAMLDKTIHFKISDKEQLINTLASSEAKLSVHPVDVMVQGEATVRNVVYYTMPLNGSDNKRGNIVFVMDTNLIKTNLETVGDNSGTSFVVDQLGKIVLATGNTALLSQLNLQEVMDSAHNEQSVEVKQMAYLPMVNKNDKSDWSFVTLTENNQFYQPLNQVLWLIGMLIIMLIVLGMGISLYFSFRYYKPIRNLTIAFNKEEDMLTDELSFLNQSITKTRSELKLLNSLVNEQAPIVRNASIINLIEGRHVEDDGIEVLERLAEVEVHFEFSLFTVVVIEIGEKSIEATSMLDVEGIVQKLNNIRSLLHDFAIEAIIPYLQNNKIIAVVNLKNNNQNSLNAVVSIVKDTLSKLASLEKRSLKIGIGKTYNSVSKINLSFIEASSALDTINTDVDKDADTFRVVYFKEIATQKKVLQTAKALQYPIEEAMLLQQSIKQGNGRSAQETLHQIFIKLKEADYPSISVQAVAADMLNSVLKTAHELGFGNDCQSFYQLRDFSDLEAIEAVLLEITVDVTDQVKAFQQDQSNDIVKQVVQYVYANYDSPDISLEEIASSHNISISYASKLIKDETGESFSSILQTLRMNKFLQLLLNSKDPIKEIVAKVGYYDVSNFTRKFRKEHGITPGEYRKKFATLQMKSM